jgi:hypothetical protein
LKSWKVLILLSVLIVNACKEAPNSFGEEFIPPGDRYNFQQSESTSLKDSTYFYEQYPEAVSYSQKLIVGKYGDFKSTALVRFPLTAPDSIKTMLSTGAITIKSTWVEMISTHYFGDKNADFDFTVHKILNQIDYKKINASTFPAVTYDPVDISSQREYKDSITTFRLDKNVVTDWIKVQYDSINTPRNYGVILKPTASTKKALAYYAYENTVSKGIRVYFEFEKVTGTHYLDTLSAFATLDTYYAENPLPAETDKYIYLVGAVTYKNKIKFELPELPINAVMNKVTLELHFDSTRSIVGAPVDTNYTTMASTINIGRLMGSNSLIIDSAAISYLTKQSSPNQNVYSGDLSEFTQKWINEKNNYGLILFLSGEEYDASKLAFYGSNYPNAALRPRLKITYSLRNQE